MTKYGFNTEFYTYNETGVTTPLAPPLESTPAGKSGKVDVPIGNQELLGVGDKLETSQQPTKKKTEPPTDKSRDKVYEDLQFELSRLGFKNIEEAKNINLLESILGCSSSDLKNKTQDELGLALDAYCEATQKFILCNDMVKLLGEANKNYKLKLATKEGVELPAHQQPAFFSVIPNEQNPKLWQYLQGRGAIPSPIANPTQEQIDEAIKKHFEGILGNIENVSETEKTKIYETLKKEFIEIAAICEDNSAAAKVIDLLPADFRLFASEIFVSSNNSEVRADNANAVLVNSKAITTRRDAYCQAPSQNDAVEINAIGFRNIRESDTTQILKQRDDESRAILDELNALKARVANGETLTGEELARLEQLELEKRNHIDAGYAAAEIALPQNENITDTTAYLNSIQSVTEELNIRQDVNQAKVNYASEYFEKLTQQQQEEIKRLEREFNLRPDPKASQPQTINTQNYKQSNSTTSNSKSSVAHTTEYQSSSKPSETSKASYSELPVTDYTATNNYEATTPSIQNTKKAEAESLGFKTTTPPIEVKQTLATPENEASNNTDKPITEEEAVTSVALFEQYSKENHLGFVAQISLALKEKNDSIKEHIIELFAQQNTGMQKLAFIKFNNVELAKAAAKEMNKKDLKDLSCRSFAISQAVKGFSAEA